VQKQFLSALLDITYGAPRQSHGHCQSVLGPVLPPRGADAIADKPVEGRLILHFTIQSALYQSPWVIVNLTNMFVLQNVLYVCIDGCGC
jgi:hypothetical protein